jgi:sigma-B regulation protein RsbU (phosphoserine phosphatase)
MVKITLKKKLIWMILAIELLMTAGAVTISYFVYSARISSEYATVSTDITSTAEAFCRKEDIASLKKQVSDLYGQLSQDGSAVIADEASAEDLNAYRSRYAAVLSSDAYRNIRQVLQTSLQNNHVRYLYVGFFDPATGQFVYMADGSVDEDFSSPGDIEIPEPVMLKKLTADNYRLTGYFDNTSSFGRLCSTYLPVYDENGQYLCNFCVDIDISKILDQRKGFLLSMTLFLLILVFPLGKAIMVFTEKRLIRPIYELNDAVSSFVSEKDKEEGVSKIASLSIHTQDEVEMLFHSVQKMENDINDYIAEITNIVGEKERMGTELAIATRIQEDMLPHIFPAFPERPEVDLYASMTPAKEVGGDFYDFFRIDADRIGIVMGDVSGKGIPGALFMMISKTLIKDTSMRISSPKEILESVNQQLCENNDAGMFVTVWLGILDLTDGRLQYVNAGHEYPACRHANGAFVLQREKHGMVLGGMEGITYSEFETHLDPGDILFIYTDGVPEATDSSDRMYGTDRMIAALNSDPDASLQGILTNVKQDVDRFVNGAPQFDDLTMLAVLYHGPVKPLP